MEEIVTWVLMNVIIPEVTTEWLSKCLMADIPHVFAIDFSYRARELPARLKTLGAETTSDKSHPQI